MRTNKVKEKDEHGNKIVGRLEGRKALFSLVPVFKLLIEALNEIVGNVVFEALDPDVLHVFK